MTDDSLLVWRKVLGLTLVAGKPMSVSLSHTLRSGLVACCLSWISLETPCVRRVSFGSLQLSDDLIKVPHVAGGVVARTGVRMVGWLKSCPRCN